MVKVSIIIPVYNVAGYIRQCLDSIVNQTLLDIEVICVDDGSMDGSTDVLREYAAKDSRVKVVLCKHVNAGTARNSGMQVAAGEYIGFVDSDDWCELTLFEKAYAKAKSEGADVILWRHREVDETSGRIVREVTFGLPPGIVSPFKGTALKDKVFSTFNYAPWNRMVKRDFVWQNQFAFQQIERSNDVVFGCLVLASASRISVVDEVLYNYRMRGAGNLQSENGKTPLSIVESWKFLVEELIRRGLLETYRTGTALASMYCFMRTLSVLSEYENEYAALFNVLKRLFSEDVFFSTVKPEEITNDIMANALRMIRLSNTFSEFAIRQVDDVNKWMGKFYRDREQARKELGDMRTELPEIRKELSWTREELVTARRELSGIRDELVKLQREKAETAARARLPGVSLLLLSNGDTESRAAFERHVEELSVADFEIVDVPEMSEDMPERACKDYVAIVRANDRYVNEYALELLVNTARCKAADVVGGYTSESALRVADFVFRLTWLRENRDLFSILRAGERAFVAAAIARAGKHVIANRIYTEYIHPISSPLVSVVVPAYNAERYLERCVKSLVGQTHRNLEIILVDDGSTDSTGRMCDAWAARDGRIRVVHKLNGGLSSARNAGMCIANGKYIGFVDSDDYVDMEMFGHLAEILECHPRCDVAKCGVAVEYTYDVSDVELKFTQAYFKDSVCGAIRPGADIVYETDVCAVDKLYRVDFLRKNGLMFPEGVKNEDEAFFFEVFCRIRDCYYVPQCYYHYLRNPDGIMARQQKAADGGELPDALRVYAFVAELLKRENRQDLFGVLYRHMVGCVQRFIGTPIESAVSDGVARILWKTQAFYYADLTCRGDRQWVMSRVYELMNRVVSRRGVRTPMPEAWFPGTPPPQNRATEHPLVSFIVPVYNVEKYIANTLESLRRQTLTDFEIICIDDGSIDDSGKVLDLYSRIDSRIKVWHLDNAGVSRARNYGLEKAVGKYVAFVDGDDRLHARMAERTVLMAERDDLDVVMFDYRCFAYDTLKQLDHYWYLFRHLNDFPEDQVFSPTELENLPIYGSSCTYLWNREFLREADEVFPAIKLGEDLVWVLSVFAKVRRMRILNVPFYEYRRGNPASAVARLQTRESDAPVLALKGLASVLDKLPNRNSRAGFLRRMISDILFYGEKMPKARIWLQEEGFEAFGGIEYLEHVCSAHTARIKALAKRDVLDPSMDIEYFIQQAPPKIQRLMHEAVVARKDTVKDMIIVCGQLNSTTNEPIDSWTFFRWLQDHGIPCRYVVWREHCMIKRMRADNGLKDVILLSGNGVDDFEFIEKCRELLPRLNAVVMENTALNPLTWRYFHMLKDCSYVFMQHGPTFWKMSPKHISSFAVANYVNVSSEAEKKFLEKYVPEHWETGRRPKYFIAGLPRWDLLRDESETEREKVIFFMPTWRATFNSGMDSIAKSAYFSGVRALVSEENLGRLKKRGLRLVMAAHHHLVNHVKDLDFNLPIELVPSSEVSYWIRHASICITDYSSVSFDFLFLNKPCIFWTPDRYDGLLRGDDYVEVVFAEHQGENMFNRVSSVEELMTMIEKYSDLKFALEPEKKDIANRYFACRKNVCERLYGQISAIDDKKGNER